jgi:hypothetical protein
MGFSTLSLKFNLRIITSLVSQNNMLEIWDHLLLDISHRKLIAYGALCVLGWTKMSSFFSPHPPLSWFTIFEVMHYCAPKHFHFFFIISNRCAKKLHYKRRKEKELEEKREQEENKRKRCQPNAIVVFTSEPICTVKSTCSLLCLFQESFKEGCWNRYRVWRSQREEKRYGLASDYTSMLHIAHKHMPTFFLMTHYLCSFSVRIGILI